MANIQHIFSGADAPVAAPTAIGHHYIQTDNGDSYDSVGTATVADWVRNPRVTKGNGAPVTTPRFVGDVYIDETNYLPYTAVNTIDVAGWSLGGGGSGGGTGPESEDYANYAYIPNGGSQTITIDVTKKVHRIDMEEVKNGSAGTLRVVLPNAVDLIGVDYSKDVQFKIFFRYTFSDGESGAFNTMTDLLLGVNGVGPAWSGLAGNGVGNSLIEGIHIPNNGDDFWGFTDVKSTLIFDVQLRASGQYTVIATRDAKAQSGG